MKKWYRIFLLQSDELNTQSPCLPEWLDVRWNWYDTMEDTEEKIGELTKKEDNYYFTVLPVYEKDKLKY